MRPKGVTRVLIVDDGAATRERMSRLLREQLGASVVGCAASREEAAELARVQGPDCIIVDLPVHDPGALQLLEALRRVSGHPPLLVVLTNETSEELKRRSLDMGVDYYLNKATEFERVVELVGALGVEP